MIRSELLIDAEHKASHVGTVHGLVVCGDVAFSGAATEYETARRFLADMCQRIGCPPENVWMVPGNHDVNRSAIAQSLLIRHVHAGLRDGGVDFLESRIRGVVEDVQARELILSPLEQYNLFATGYGSGCAIDSEKFYWEHDLPLNDGSTLRLRGINSTLVSGPDDDTQAKKLIVGEMQTQMLREDGVSYMTLCHHPLDWLIDADAVTDALNTRAAIQIYGHKHRQRVTPIGENSLIISAGAVQPSRGESGWVPTYNILSLSVEGGMDQRYLNIELQSRRWNESERCFVAEVGAGDASVRNSRVKLWRWSGEHRRSTAIADDKGHTSPPLPSVDSPAVSHIQKPHEIPLSCEEVIQLVNPERRLMFRLFGLPYHQIIRIAATLDLVTDEDKSVKDAERFQRYFRRAKERGQLAELWFQVEQQYGEGQQDMNPFRPPTPA